MNKQLLEANQQTLVPIKKDCRISIQKSSNIMTNSWQGIADGKKFYINKAFFDRLCPQNLRALGSLVQSKSMQLRGFYKADKSQDYVFTIATDTKFSFSINNKVYTSSTISVFLEKGYHLISITLTRNGNLRFFNMQVGTEPSNMKSMQVAQKIDGSQTVSKAIGESKRNAYKHEVTYNFRENLIVGQPYRSMFRMRSKKFKECLIECNI